MKDLHLCLLNTQALKDLGNTSCNKFLLTKKFKSVLMLEVTPTRGKIMSKE